MNHAEAHHAAIAASVRAANRERVGAVVLNIGVMTLSQLLKNTTARSAAVQLLSDKTRARAKHEFSGAGYGRQHTPHKAKRPLI